MNFKGTVTINAPRERALEQKVEAFVFSTRLTRITRQLRERNLDEHRPERRQNRPRTAVCFP
ncbi:MAG TPA: hypothetical protein VNA04_18755 [Thermoanaerobaculia bacterium]|nr:hypothetical protein [Thermoanaerobaculia bacterium]